MRTWQQCKTALSKAASRAEIKHSTSISSCSVKINGEKESLAKQWQIPNSSILLHSCKTRKLVTNAGVTAVLLYTWNNNLQDSLPHLNAVVTPENCNVYVAYMVPLTQNSICCLRSVDILQNRTTVTWRRLIVELSLVAS